MSVALFMLTFYRGKSLLQHVRSEAIFILQQEVVTEA